MDRVQLDRSFELYQIGPLQGLAKRVKSFVWLLGQDSNLEPFG
jgi:hypothetical protein